MHSKVDVKHAMDNHFLRSSYREKLLEHLFTGEVMKYLWRSNKFFLEMLSPQVDSGGYDLVLEANSIVRHVQLKGTFNGSKVARWPVNLGLVGKPSGCVIVIKFDQDTLKLGPYLWLGGKPGKALPDISDCKMAKHANGNAQGEKLFRKNSCIVPRAHFEQIEDIKELSQRLFGTLSPLKK